MIDPKLLEWATPTQAKYIEAVNLHGSGGAAALVLGVSKSNVNNAIKAVRIKAAAAGYAPDHHMIHAVPQPFTVKGVSTFFGRDGTVRGQWVKSQWDHEDNAEALKEFVEWLGIEGVRGLAPITPRPEHANSSLLAFYGLGDPHFGMSADKDEAGEHFDTATAERLTCAAIDRLVDSSPPAAQALIFNAGDMFHADDQTNRTPGHGNHVDVDGRHFRILQVGRRAMIHCIRRALEKHDHVKFVITPGNQDPRSSFALALILDAHFESEPRVTVDFLPTHYKYHRFGLNLIGMTHGDGAKQSDLGEIMATDVPADWGATKFRVWFSGHIHHDTVKELRGVRCESLRTLAPSDAWHRMKGYRAGRDMRLVIFHEDYGEIERHRCDAAMVT